MFQGTVERGRVYERAPEIYPTVSHVRGDEHGVSSTVRRQARQDVDAMMYAIRSPRSGNRFILTLVKLLNGVRPKRKSRDPEGWFDFS